MRDAAISVRVEGDLKAELVRLAKEEGRTLAQYVERILAAHVASHPPKKPRK